MKTKHVAIVASTISLAEAIKSSLEPKMKGFTFSHINRVSDRPPGSQIACLGLPPFIPGNETVIVKAFGTKYDKDATADDRRADYEVIRSEESTVEQVLERLGNFTDYQITTGSQLTETKMALADAKMAIIAATTPEEQLAAYKEAYELLASALA